MTESIYYFGYGSLVNRATRPPDEPYVRATLRGWIRQWSHQAQRPWKLDTQSGPGVCALTVSEQPGSSIDGVLVPIEPDRLPELDQRESGYRRLTLPFDALDIHPADQDLPWAPTGSATVLVYVSQRHEWASIDYPMLSSYVHCVLRGFADQFGDEGVERMMRSTEGWRLPLMDDRHQPLYPRAVVQSAERLAELDAVLVSHGVQLSTLSVPPRV